MKGGPKLDPDISIREPPFVGEPNAPAPPTLSIAGGTYDIIGSVCVADSCPTLGPPILINNARSLPTPGNVVH